MMDIMIQSVILPDPLQRIPRDTITAMIIHRLQGGDGEEADALPDAQTSKLECQTASNSVFEEAFQRMIVKCSKGVWDVEAVVMGVKGPV